MQKTKQKTGTFSKKSAILGGYVAFVLLVFVGLVIHLLEEEPVLLKPEEVLLGTDTAPEKRGDVEAVIREFEGDTPDVPEHKPALAPQQGTAPEQGTVLKRRETAEIADVSLDTPEPAPAWQREAAPWASTSGPKIAIIIDDLGLNTSATSALSAITPPLTLAFLPYADHLPDQTRLAHQGGHELMVHLPMQSQLDTADPGDNALLETLSYEEFNRRLKWNLNRFDGFVGVNNHMGSRLTENPEHMVRLMQQLHKDGHLFIDSLTTPNSVGVSAAKAAGVPYASRDIFLDNERNAAYIRKQLASAERIARKRGYAIAIGHPYPETIAVLTEWRKTNDARGITLVPASQIVLEALEKRLEKSR